VTDDRQTDHTTEKCVAIVGAIPPNTTLIPRRRYMYKGAISQKLQIPVGTLGTFALHNN